MQKVFKQHSEPFDIYVNKSLQAFPEFSSGELSEVLELVHTSDHASIPQKQRQCVSDIVIIVRSRVHGRCKRESFCLKSTETRLFIRAGGGGRGGRERERRLDRRRQPGRPRCRGPPPEQQNIKAVSVSPLRSN